jgi:ABC-type polysaccharide/polyol phosphate export permease
VATAYASVLYIGFCVGLILGSVKRYFPVFEELLRPLKRLGIFISGVVILGAEVPYFARPYFFWNPIFKAIEIARVSWYPSYRSPIFLPWDVVLTCLTLSAIGFTCERITRRNASI